MAWAAWVCLGAASIAAAQQPPLHFQHPVGIPPGVIGSQQLQRGGPARGFFQPVEIKAPAGTLIAVAEGGTIGMPQPAPAKVGLLVGQVYRICVLNIPLHPGQELFPTIEVVDRLYTPNGQELRFPVQIELTQEDLDLASNGKFVTRVVYLEDPKQPLPIASGDKGQTWFEAPPGTDPLVVADGLGRPMAIVRIGGRVPDVRQGVDTAFLFGCPPVIKYLNPPVPHIPATGPVWGTPFVPESAGSPPLPSGPEVAEAIQTTMPDGRVAQPASMETERTEPKVRVLSKPPRRTAERSARPASSWER